MKASQLREQSVEELRQTSMDMAKELAGLRIKKGVGDASEQPLRIRTLRRELARAKTIIREREREKTTHG